MGTAYNNFALLVGRIFLSAIFLDAGYGKITDFAGTLAFMGSRPAFASMTAALPILACLAIFAEVGGGLSLLLGWLTRLGAIGLVLFLLPTVFIFHNFWAYPPEAQMMQQMMFMKDLAIVGGLLALSVAGAGAYSVDGRKKAH